MADKKKPLSKDEIIKKKALSRWENEGGQPTPQPEQPPMKTIPAKMVAYRRTDTFTNETIPAALLKDHNTKAGTWGLIKVEKGRLKYTIKNVGVYLLNSKKSGVVEPEVLHSVKPLGKVEFYVEFYHEGKQLK